MVNVMNAINGLVSLLHHLKYAQDVTWCTTVLLNVRRRIGHPTNICVKSMQLNLVGRISLDWQKEEVANAYERKLKPFEENIFCFARVCFVCKESDPALLTRQFGYLCCSLPLEIPEVFQSLQNKTMLNKIPKILADGQIMDDVFQCLMSDVLTYPLSLIYGLEKVAVKLGKQEQIISEVQELTVHLVGSRCNKDDGD